MLQPERQASNFTHIKGPLKYSLKNAETGRRHIYTLPLPHSKSLLPHRKELLNLSGVLGFVAATQRTPLDHMDLVDSWAYIPESHRSVTNGGHSAETQTETPSLPKKETY